MKNLKSINEFWGAVIRRDMSSAVREEEKFHNKEELQGYLKKEINKQGKNVVIKNLDVSGIEDLNSLFHGLLNDVETLNLSGWNLDGVKDIRCMFFDCENLKFLDLSGWDTGKVRYMNWMFIYCINLKSLDLSGWKSDNVEDMNNMFYFCKNLESLDLSGWDVANVKNMRGMFRDCYNLESLNLSGWDTKSVESMRGMFNNCPAPYEIVDNKIVKK